MNAHARSRSLLTAWLALTLVLMACDLSIQFGSTTTPAAPTAAQVAATLPPAATQAAQLTATVPLKGATVTRAAPNPSIPTATEPPIPVPTLQKRTPAGATPAPTLAIPQGAGFGAIIFCEDVSDDGKPINPASAFPRGTDTVWAFFNYWGMRPGVDWGRYWTLDGDEFVDSTGDTWEEASPSGWVAYSISDEPDLAAGEYTLTLYLGEKEITSASFTVLETGQAESSPAIGVIQFAEDVTDETVPIKPGDSFKEGITRVYGVFPYYNMTDGQIVQVEWTRDGSIIGENDYTWADGEEGITYFYLNSKDGLGPGKYRLNLYIDGQIARAAAFTVQAKAVPTPKPGTPQELIDASLLRAWQILANSKQSVLREVAQFALDHGIQIRMSTSIGSLGVYHCYADRYGSIEISKSHFDEVSWEEVAGTIAHELTHAVQYGSRKTCGCTIEKEYYAYVTEFYVLQETGRMDILGDKWSGIYDSNGKFSKSKLWAAIKKAYKECPEY